MNRYLESIVIAAIFVCLAPGAAASPHMGMDSATSAAAFAKIFGDNAAFSATAQMSIKHANGKNDHTFDMQYYVRDGKVRMNMDLAKMAKNIPPASLDRMKKMGMQHYSVILHPGTNNHSVMLYPDLKAYIDVGPHREQDKRGKVQIKKTRLGTAKVDGHPCTKYQLTVTQPDGSKGTMYEWEATDLNNFPVKLEMSGDKTVTGIVFKHIDRKAPNASLFDVPKDYKQYSSVQKLMFSQMSKMMGGGMGNMFHSQK